MFLQPAEKMPNADGTVVKVTGVRLPDPLVTGPQVRNAWVRWREDWEDYAVVQELEHKTPSSPVLTAQRWHWGPKAKSC